MAARRFASGRGNRDLILGWHVMTTLRDSMFRPLLGRSEQEALRWCRLSIDRLVLTAFENLPRRRGSNSAERTAVTSRAWVSRLGGAPKSWRFSAGQGVSPDGRGHVLRALDHERSSINSLRGSRPQPAAVYLHVSDNRALAQQGDRHVAVRQYRREVERASRDKVMVCGGGCHAVLWVQKFAALADVHYTFASTP